MSRHELELTRDDRSDFQQMTLPKMIASRFVIPIGRNINASRHKLMDLTIGRDELGLRTRLLIISTFEKGHIVESGAQYEQAWKSRIDKIRAPHNSFVSLGHYRTSIVLSSARFVNVHYYPSSSFNEASVSPVEVRDNNNKGLTHEL